MNQQEIGLEFLKALNRYFTPVGVGIVVAGMLVNPDLPSWIRGACTGLVVASLLFNMLSAVYVVEHPASWKKVGYFRVIANFAMNAAAYVLLRKYWGMAWVLFSLGPVAMAFYGDIAETFVVLGAVCMVMAGCLWFDRVGDIRVWGEIAAQAFFILLLSLFLIKMAALIRREKAEARA